MSKQAVETKGYKKTHIDTYRYRCKKTSTGFPVHQKGNYESLVSFTALPPYKEFKEKGRSWKYTKQYHPVMDRILLDIDCEDLETAFDVTKKIMQEIDDVSDHINVYFSGSKGFHIEILTELLDIVDTSVDKPMDSCYQYVEFLNYFMDKYPQVDLNLKDVGTRIIRIHHTKHEKTGNFKILVNLNASLDDILTSSKADRDMVKPADRPLLSETALLLMDTYRKPIQQDITLDDLEIEAYYVDYDSTDINIFTDIFNELNTNIHDKIKLIGVGLNGYVDIKEAEIIYNHLAKTTDIEESANAKGSFITAYEKDKIPRNLGALKNHYEKYNLDQTNFEKLSYYLNSKVQSKDYDTFNDLMQNNDNDWYQLLDEKLYDYVDNTNNIFNGIIHSLMALFGYGSRFIVVNGGAEVGKSEYVTTIKKLMPRFKNMGSSTPASIRRQSEYAFNKKIVYLGDKGLKGSSQSAEDEFEGLYEVFGGLVTDKEFVRDIVVGDKVMEFNLKSDGICVFYTEPYTNLRKFGAGDQYTTRSTGITVNPVEDGLSVFLQDDTKPNEFYNIHRNYIKHILNHPIEVKISDDVKTELWYASRDGLRTAKYLLGLFKAYCQYLQIGNPLTTDVNEFLKVFKPKLEVTDIEYEIYRKLYKNLTPIDSEDIEDYYWYDRNGNIEIDKDSMLLQSRERKEKSFFTAKQIKTYFKQDFKRNKNLKDTLDQVPDILNNLFNAGYIDKVEWQYNGQNVYYIPINNDMD